MTQLRYRYLDDETGKQAKVFNPYDHKAVLEVWNGSRWMVGHTIICGGMIRNGDLIQVRLPEIETFTKINSTIPSNKP